jgi:hypothetical protein
MSEEGQARVVGGKPAVCQLPGHTSWHVPGYEYEARRHRPPPCPAVCCQLLLDVTGARSQGPIARNSNFQLPVLSVLLSLSLCCTHAHRACNVDAVHSFICV